MDEYSIMMVVYPTVVVLLVVREVVGDRLSPTVIIQLPQP
jgi:hypothetical protein